MAEASQPRERRATKVYAAAHGLFIGDSAYLLFGTELDKIIVTDGAPRFG